MTDRDRWFVLHAGEIDDWAVGFSGRLNAGETLSGVPKVTVHQRTGDKAQYAGVTISQVGRNTAQVTDADGVDHEIDEAVEFRVTADDAAVEAVYTLRAECSSTAGRSLVEAVKIDLRGPPET